MNITRLGTLTILRPLLGSAHDLQRFNAIEAAPQPQSALARQPSQSLDQPSPLPQPISKISAINASDSENKVYDQNGITLTTRKRKNSAFHELHGRIQTQGNLASAEQILLEPQNIQQWLDGLETIDVIKPSPGKGNFTLHAKTRGIPLLIPAREIVINCQVQRDNRAHSVMLSMTRVEPEQDQDKRSIYVKAFDGQMSIQQTQSNQLTVAFRCHTDPGGQLPASAVNQVSTNSVIKSLKNVQNLLITNTTKAGEPLK